MSDATRAARIFSSIVGDEHVSSGDAVSDDYSHDEALTCGDGVRPLAVVCPGTDLEVAAVVKAAKSGNSFRLSPRLER